MSTCYVTLCKQQIEIVTSNKNKIKFTKEFHEIFRDYYFIARKDKGWAYSSNLRLNSVQMCAQGSILKERSYIKQLSRLFQISCYLKVKGAFEVFHSEERKLYFFIVFPV